MRSWHHDRLVGRRLGQYLVCAPIGSGGMGTVYLARDVHQQRDVAVKVIEEGFSAAELPRTLVDEARILSRLVHPNIASVLDVNSAEGYDFLVLEFVPGRTLEELLAGAPLPPAEVVRLGTQMAMGLAAAHAAGVIHRDVKPANIKITPDGQLKLLDFGIAALVRDARPASRITTHRGQKGPLGTLPFMAPEQLRGEAADERSDIFSAGAVLYQMATARPPFPQRQLACLIDAVLNRDPVPPRVINLALSDRLEAVVLRALRKRPAQRYQTAAALAAALEAAAGEARDVPWRLSSSARRWWSLLRRGATRAPTSTQVLRT